MASYEERRAALAKWLEAEGLDYCLIMDFEGGRDPALRWLTGHPSDAALVVGADGSALLSPWDAGLARLKAPGIELMPYTEAGRDPRRLLSLYLGRRGAKKARVELPAATSHPSFLEFVAALAGHELICRDGGLGAALSRMRARKDPAELEALARACAIADELSASIAERLRGGWEPRELDVALYIEAECRARGCEGIAFETLAAGPARSFGIHAFPAYGPGPFASRGLSILDFGVCYEGYRSDVTVSFAKGPLAAGQERMIKLVEAAYAAATALLKPGVAAIDVARAADDAFAAAGAAMPHALGHGIGLEAHEAPLIRNKEGNDWKLEPGMVFTIEPGLYDLALGGVRLEDDWLMEEGGARRLTSSFIARL
jgi:Xaa-Pro dipeptidase